MVKKYLMHSYIKEERLRRKTKGEKKAHNSAPVLFTGKKLWDGDSVFSFSSVLMQSSLSSDMEEDG